VVLAGVHPSHVVAERAVAQPEREYQRADLEEAGRLVRHSETLRKQQGHHEVAGQEHGQDETGDVLRAHSRSTPFKMASDTRKNRQVSPMRTRSGIEDSRV
jgi:hypothetical protein